MLVTTPFAKGMSPVYWPVDLRNLAANFTLSPTLILGFLPNRFDGFLRLGCFAVLAFAQCGHLCPSFMAPYRLPHFLHLTTFILRLAIISLPFQQYNQDSGTQCQCS